MGPFDQLDSQQQHCLLGPWVQARPQQEQLLAEVVLAYASEVQQRAVTWLLAFEASDPHI